MDICPLKQNKLHLQSLSWHLFDSSGHTIYSNACEHSNSSGVFLRQSHATLRKISHRHCTTPRCTQSGLRPWKTHLIKVALGIRFLHHNRGGQYATSLSQTFMWYPLNMLLRLRLDILLVEQTCHILCHYINNLERIQTKNFTVA